MWSGLNRWGGGETVPPPTDLIASSFQFSRFFVDIVELLDTQLDKKRAILLFCI